ncbi:hypothetical protein BGZ83_011415, partial [Gryganskiella cystojenkinii]
MLSSTESRRFSNDSCVGHDITTVTSRKSYPGSNHDQEYDEKSQKTTDLGGGGEEGGGGDGDAGSSSTGSNTQTNGEDERTMGLVSAILMIIGTLIGTGIFASPGPLFDVMHCPQTALIIWGVAGIVCGIGAYAYAELGTMFPASGGDFQYLSRAYGRKMALLFGWSFIVVLNPIGTAGIAGVLGRYSVDVITYFRTGNSVGLGAGGDGGKRIPNGGPLEIAPHHRKLLNRFQGRQPLNRTAMMSKPSQITATGTSAMVAKRFLDGENNDPGEDEDSEGGYYFYEMGDDDLDLYDNFARKSYWIPDPSSQQQQTQQQQGLVQDQDDNPSVEGESPTFPKPPLPGNHTGQPQPGTGPDGQPLLPTIHAENMPFTVRLFSIASIVVMGLINILFKQGGKWASNILAVFKIAGMLILIGIGTMHAIKTQNQSETFKIPLNQCSHNILDYVSAFCYAFFAYNGFNNINLGLGELRNPERNLKYAVLLGQPGGFMMAGTVIASALGSINANIWAGSRLLVILAQDNTIIPVTFSKTWKRSGTTALAMLVLVLQASFHAMLNLDFKTFSKIYSAVGWWWSSNARGQGRKMTQMGGGFGNATLGLSGIQPGTSQYLGDDDENDDDEGEGDLDGTMPGGSGSRFVPLIMFAAVAGLMLLIIPAYYGTSLCTKRRERRRVIKHERAEILAAEETAAAEPMTEAGESSHSCCNSGEDSGSSGSEDESSEKRRSGVENEKYLESDDDSDYFKKSEQADVNAHSHSIQDNQWNFQRDRRRDSAASSITLVDETTGRRLHRSRCHRHQHHQRRHNSHHRRSRRRSKSPLHPLKPRPSLECDIVLPLPNNILIENADEEEEEELARVKSLRASKLQYHRNQLSLDPFASPSSASSVRITNSRKNSRRQSVMTLFGDYNGEGGGSSRNGSTSRSSPVLEGEVSTTMPGSYFTSFGPEHPFDQPLQQQRQHDQPEQRVFIVPRSQFYMSPMSSPLMHG